MGADCVDWFLNKMLEFEKVAMEHYFDEQRLVMTDLEEFIYSRDTKCWICKKWLDPAANDKVKDHDHVTGRFRGAAHRKCNLRLRRTCKIPVFFHNFKGYDSHFITLALSRYGGEKIKVIGQGMEKYIILSLGRYLVFKDSLQFLGCSLQTLADNLAKTGIDKFQYLKKQCGTTSPDKLKPLVRKGVYPYEYMDSFDKLEEDRLSPKEAFYSRLHDAQISDAEYAHAQNVWQTFGIPTMRLYHNLYLMSIIYLYFINFNTLLNT